ncbi:DUF1559 domain-containing protein [Bremerella cremea]|uniref:DUF1559 domain-containing protein n=1 Tax=Bremerella cremea TaxID=1031537 RepID=A0A368KNA2_9BACT|nr:DUF1559 domain-containing protein [Bremerella cremea]RCS41423.1 DUF1559 domain-containing protein [Bremerella cremea]
MQSLRHAILVGFLSALMAVPPSALVAQEQAASAPKTKIAGLSFIPENAVGIIQVQADRILTSPYIWAYPVEVVEAYGKKYFGFNPMKITGITLVMTPPFEGEEEPEGYAIVQTSETLNEETFFAGIGSLVDYVATRDDLDDFFPTLKGKVFAVEDFPGEMCCAHLLDEHTFLIGMQAIVADIAEAGPNAPITTPAKLLAENTQDADLSAILNMAPVRDLINQSLEKEEIPAEFAEVRQIPNDTESISVRINLIESSAAALKLNAVDEAAAKRLETLINSALDKGKQLANQAAEMDLQSENPLQVAMGKYQVRTNTQMFENLKPTREGKSLVLKHEQDPNTVVGTNVMIMGVMVGLLLPAVQQARAAARRVQSTNNMKQIGLAMHNYHDTVQALPAQASTGKDGKKLLSWRVHILPFLEQQELYEQFHLDEPWDSEHNKQLIQFMPDTFKDPVSTAPEYHTTYLVPLGKNMAFEQPTPETKEKWPTGVRFRDFSDGISNTALLLNVNDDAAVIWTKPDDLEIDLTKPWNHLDKSMHLELQVLRADGSILALPTEMSGEFLQLLLQRNDGKPLPW